MKPRAFAQVPDRLILENNNGCSLSMVTDEASSLEEIKDSYENKVGATGDVNKALFTGSFSADAEWCNSHALRRGISCCEGSLAGFGLPPYTREFAARVPSIHTYQA